MGSCKDTLVRLRNHFYPTGYVNELIPLVKLAWPAIFTSLLLTLLLVINTAMCGRISVIALDAVGLANSMLSLLGIEFGFGLATACDTLFSQAFGGMNKHRVGMLVQRSFFVMMMFAFPLAALFVNMEPIFLLLGQDPEISLFAANYLVVAIPSLVVYYAFLILCRYMQTQDVMIPTMIITLIGNVLIIGMNFLSLSVLKLEVYSSAIAFDIVLFVMAVLTIVYIRLSKFYRPTWDGFTAEALFEVLNFLKLAIFGIMMVGMEPLLIEITLFMAGKLSAVELGAQTIIVQYDAVAYAIPVGLSIAVSVRIGQHAGANDSEGAWTTMWVALSIAPLIGLIFMTTYTAGASVLPWLFTTDPEVAALATSVMPILAGTVFCDLVNSALVGTVRGFGKQNIGAFVSFFGTYFVNLPVGFSLAFVAGLSIAGIWWGFIVGLIFQITFYLIYLSRLDWQKTCNQVREEAGLTTTEFRNYSVDVDRDRPVALAHSNSKLNHSDSHDARDTKMYNSRGLADSDEATLVTDIDRGSHSDVHVDSWNRSKPTYDKSQVKAKVIRGFVIYGVLITVFALAAVYQFSIYRPAHNCSLEGCDREEHAPAASNATTTAILNTTVSL